MPSNNGSGKDYRISYLMQNCKEEPFFIKDISRDGIIIFENPKSGITLKLKTKLPRKILSYDGETEIYVTRKKFILKDKPAETPSTGFTVAYMCGCKAHVPPGANPSSTCERHGEPILKPSDIKL